CTKITRLCVSPAPFLLMLGPVAMLIAPRIRAPLIAGFALALYWAAPLHAADLSGEQVFKSKCANCHGSQGQGSPKYKQRLEGDKSLAHLWKYIFDSMPESNPGSLSEKEAERVAAYIHESFYSTVARERNRPARVELARLTVKQYRQTVADLVGNFRGPPAPWGDQRGLRGEYFKGRHFNQGSRVLERVDPQVNFDFGTNA